MYAAGIELCEFLHALICVMHYSDFDRTVFDSGLVRIGAFRCHPGHPAFHNSGPPENCCFVFPRTAVAIQHEHEQAFVANPNVVTFYNKGQSYLRNAISTEGDRCDWFGVDIDIVQDVVREFDPNLASRPERPFRFTHAWTDAHTYLLQRRTFEHVVSGTAEEPLGVEELVVNLLERVIRAVYGRSSPSPSQAMAPSQRDIVHHVELVLSERWEEHLRLRDIAAEAEVSVYHLCRMFRRATGMTLHNYRQRLRVRWSLESVMASSRPLVDIALEAGFSSHSHFTSSFQREFAHTPSVLRASKGIGRVHG